MDRIRLIITYIARNLRRLTPTHKLLIAAAVIIMAMSLVIASLYAGKPDLVLVQFDSTGRLDATGLLAARGIAYEEAPQGLMVPEDRRLEAIAILTQNGVSGANSNANLMELLNSQQWWHNRQQNQQTMNAALSQVLGQIISGWSYVRDARVIISSPLERPGLGVRQVKPSASVVVTPRAGPLDDAKVEAIAQFVAGAVGGGLEPEAVRIVDERAGRSMRVRSGNAQTPSNYLETLGAIEAHWESKITEALRIPDAVVTVNAQIDADREVFKSINYRPDKRGSTSIATSETESTSDQTDGSNAGAVPGVQPNTGTNLTSATSGGGAGSNTSDTETKFEVAIGSETIERINAGGYARKINATINLPRSYFARIWQMTQTDAAAIPTDADLLPIITAQTTRVQNMVKPLIDTALLAELRSGTSGVASGASADGEVVVSWYYDFGGSVTGDSGSATQEAGAGSWSIPGSGFLGVSLRGVGMLALAVVAMFMMFRLTRASAPKRDLPTAEELAGIPPTIQGETADLIGEADQSNPAMDAVELTDDAIRSQSLVDQVEDLINTNTEETSRLLSRWISPNG